MKGIMYQNRLYLYPTKEIKEMVDSYIDEATPSTIRATLQQTAHIVIDLQDSGDVVKDWANDIEYLEINTNAKI